MVSYLFIKTSVYSASASNRDICDNNSFPAVLISFTVC
jgi:hypothetical protein